MVIGKIKYPAAGTAQFDATLTNVFREFNLRLQALVEEGSAQILSRPSVLTLDNRMAYINVSEKIPIANTKFVKDYVSAVDFRDVTAGIELAVRPRISRSGDRYLFKLMPRYLLVYQEKMQMSWARMMLFWQPLQHCLFER